MDADLLRDIAAPPVPPVPPTPASAAAAAPAADPKAAVQGFLADTDVQQKIIALAGDGLAPLAAWLARLLLLYPVPFNLLVADSRMLEMETLRFFYLDNNWLGALLDGALGIGMESSRETFFHAITRDLIHRSAFEAAQACRSQLTGVEPPSAEAAENLISGFLLRSAVVSGWPNLAVRPGMNDGTRLKILRMDHLAPNLLLCLCWGVPDFVEFSEPQEGFRFGVDDDGQIPLRQPLAPQDAGGTPLGTPLDNNFPVRPAFLRSPDRGVLRLSPDSSDGLVQQIGAALATAAGAAVPDFGPSDFALQMVKSPEAIRFTTQSR